MCAQLLGSLSMKKGRSVFRCTRVRSRYSSPKARTSSVQVNKYEAQGNVTCSQEFGTARMNGVEPEAWLTDVIARKRYAEKPQVRAR